MSSSHLPPETKAFTSDVIGAFEEFARTFEAFKDTNDQRLHQIEQRLSSDVVTEEKLARIDTALDEARSKMERLVLNARRPNIGEGRLEGERGRDPVSQDHKSAFHLYMRSGESYGLKRLEQKALSTTVGADGGFLVPEHIEQEVLRRMSTASPIRAISSVMTISGGAYKKAFSTTGPTAGWVAETAARPLPSGDSPTLAELNFPAMELYAMPAATQVLLDDAVVNIDQWIADEVEQVFAEQESTAFVSGNGTNKPKGFLSYTTVANSAWTWGNIGVNKTGAAGAFFASNPTDNLIDLIYALKAGYRQNAHFIMNRKTQSVIRKFRDSTGAYLWQPPAGAGQSASIFSFPIIESEDMPDIANNSLSVAFGDFKRGYLIVDRAGVRVLRDPYSSKPYVLFYVTKRVGGGVQDFDSIKLLQFGV
jgi:HK97 family phage major capsid protein